MRKLNILQFDKKKQENTITGVAVREIDLITEALRLLGPECTISIRQICFQLLVGKYEGTERQELVNAARFLAH